jgi:pseudaminic acid cytidylyltransferase
MKSVNNIAIITARKGSVRIKNKNLKLFLGKPIIFYSIKILQKTKIFDLIVVSTNCDRTERIAKKYGVRKIIRRPDNISNNKTGTIKVINHSIEELRKNKIFPKYICCMYPASPLTSYKNIKFSYNLMKKKFIKFVFPSTSLIKVKNINEEKKIIKIKKIRRKEGIVNDIYLDAAQFYYASTNTWKKSKTAFLKKSLTFLINDRVSDINTMSDWKAVKKIFIKKNKKYNYLSKLL